MRVGPHVHHAGRGAQGRLDLVGRTVQADLQLQLVTGQLGRELRHAALGQDPAGVEDRDAVADLVHLVEQVARQQDRDAAVAGEGLDERQHLGHAGRVDRRRRLVQDQDGRILDEGVGQAEALAHAARVLLHPPPGGIREADLLQEQPDPVVRGASLDSVEGGRVAQVLGAGHLSVEAHVVGQIAHPTLHFEGLPGRVEARHAGPAVGGLREPQEHQDGRGLAGPVRPQQAEDLARPDGKVELVDGDEVAVGLRQPVGLDRQVRLGRLGRRAAHEAAPLAHLSAGRSGGRPSRVRRSRAR